MGEQIKHVSRWTRPRTPLLLLPLEHLFYCPLVRFLPAWDERRVFPLSASASVCLCPRPHAPARARAPGLGCKSPHYRLPVKCQILALMRNGVCT